MGERALREWKEATHAELWAQCLQHRQGSESLGCSSAHSTARFQHPLGIRLWDRAAKGLRQTGEADFPQSVVIVTIIR